MLRPLFLLIGFVTSMAGFGQQIHAHNDYVQARPLLNAMEQKADYIEADVWLRDGKIVVSHDTPNLNAPTLDSLYLQPIVKRFAQYNGRVSDDRSYTFSLMIDVKQNPNELLPALVALLNRHVSVFNRASNKLAIQVVISGDRPRPEQYTDFPILKFDGRPAEVYDPTTLKQVALISDSFTSYSRWNGTGDIPKPDRDKLKRIIKRAHAEGKPIRFWAIPDKPESWKQLKKLGVDVINTDHVAEAVEAMR